MEKDDIERILKNIPIDGAEIGAFLRDATPEQRKQYQDKAKPKRERARLKAEIKYWRHLHKFKLRWMFQDYLMPKRIFGKLTLSQR